MIPPNNSELKDCPFCPVPKPDSASVRQGMGAREKDKFWYVECVECGAMGPSSDNSPDAAIAAWNRRADAWIKVEDWLPEDGVPVLSYRFPRGFILVYIYETKWLTVQYGRRISKPSYWQPLPNPPEVGR